MLGRCIARSRFNVAPSRGGAKEFVASIERQRAQIATIAKALGIQPTR